MATLKLSHSRIIPALASVLILGGFCIARLLNASLLERLEQVSYDLRVRSAQHNPAPCATNLGFIYINDATISAVKNKLLGPPYGLYWPRHVYGLLLEEAAKEGAQTIAFDVLFGELRPDLGGTVRAGRIIDSDEFLAEQMRLANNVLLACKSEVIPPNLFLTNAAALGDITTEKDSTDGVLRRVRAFQDYHLWAPAFRAVEADPDYGVDLSKAQITTNEVILPRLGGDDIRVPLDREGMFSLADFYGDNLPDGMPKRALPYRTLRVWHMGVVLAARQLGLDLDTAEVDLDHGRIVLRGDGVERVIPVDHEGRFYVDWSIPVNDPRLYQEPAVNLLRRSVAREEGMQPNPLHPWAGKLVIVGSTATGNDLSDTGATPIQKKTFLVSEHWNVANSIIVNRFIHRGTPIQETAMICFAGALASLAAWRLRPISALGLTSIGAAGYVLLAFGVYSRYRIWLPIVVPVAAAASLYAVITTWRVVFEQGERRRVKSVFSKVVSPNVVSELLDAKELALGGARREITVFFADVRGFTALTDQAQETVAEEVRKLGLGGEQARALYNRQAEETLNTVNLYLAIVADVVKKHNGTLDKYIGDCVMAFWGAPTPNPQHALECVRAAIEAQRAIETVNVERARANANAHGLSQPLPLLSLGTGINTGEATVGLMGSDAHILNYTVFGREVNVASRLEGVSGRGRIIIGDATYQHLLHEDGPLAAACIGLEPVSVKGIREPVKIYEVPWREQSGRSATDKTLA